MKKKSEKIYIGSDESVTMEQLCKKRRLGHMIIGSVALTL